MIKMNQSNSPAINEEVFNSFSSAMGEIFEEIVRMFFDESKKLISNMQNQIDNNEISDLQITAHTLKSSAQTLGALQLSTICGEIEGLPADDHERIPSLFDDLLQEHKAAIQSITEKVTFQV